MKKIVFLLIAFALIANVSAQLEVDSSGNTHVGGDIYIESTPDFSIGTTNDVPITFKVNNASAGFTGNSWYANVSFGYGALPNLLVGGVNANTAVGFEALRNNMFVDNTAIGHQALYYNKWGEMNVATGKHALYNSEGNGNTANGMRALYSDITGYANTALGFGADVNAGNLSNATAIGSGAVVDSSNHVRIGNDYVTKIGGYATWTTYPSDGRAKKNIRANVPGVDFIKLLQPVTYNLDLDVVDELQRSDDPKINAFRDSLRMARSPEQKEIEAQARANKEKIVYSGFIAQDVEAAAKSVGYDFSGVDAVGNGKGTYGIRYAEFVVPLVKAVQELSAQVNELTELVNRLDPNILKSESNAPDKTEATDIVDPIIAQCKLYQNAPNPFNENTQIRFFILESIKVAKLCIYNLQGTQVKQIMITQRGEGSQRISGSELNAGMYLYALIVDGREVDVKRMILTE